MLKFVQKFVNLLIKAKSWVIFLLLLLILVLYAICGGIVFYIFEHENTAKTHIKLSQTVINCTARVLRIADQKLTSDQKAKRIYFSCFDQCNKTSQPWTTVGGMVFAYSVITTLGYPVQTVNTNNGRLFYIFYCLIGIPLGLVFLGHLGKYMEEGVGLIKKWWKRKRNSQSATIKVDIGDNEENGDFEISGLLFLFVFFMYITLGVVGCYFVFKKSVSDSIYINFNALTAIDAIDFLNVRGLLLIVSLTYVTGGLALATVAIGVIGSNYLKKLHNWGKKLENSGQKQIWFGGKRMTVNNLLKTVGQHLGIDEEEIMNLDLDKIVTEQLDQTGVKRIENFSWARRVFRPGKRMRPKRRHSVETTIPAGEHKLSYRTNHAFDLRMARHRDWPIRQNGVQTRVHLSTPDSVTSEPKCNDDKKEDERKLNDDNHIEVHNEMILEVEHEEKEKVEKSEEKLESENKIVQAVDAEIQQEIQ